MVKLIDRVALDETNTAHQALIEDVQCNTLSSHSRPNTHYFFLSFPVNANAALILKSLARGDRALPRGLELESELGARRRRVKRAKAPEKERYRSTPGFSTSLLLTARCYTDFLLPNFQLPSDCAFRSGMPGRDAHLVGARRLNDAAWATRAAPLHAVFAVGYDAEALDWQVVRRGVVGWLEEHGVTVREEAGYLLRHPTAHYTIEPFGYRDAISQPKFFKEDQEARVDYGGQAAAPAGRGYGSIAPLSLVLVPDPNGASRHASGTYVAYRRIEQDVNEFYRQAAALAAQAPARDGNRLSRDQVADLLIGRRADGTPLEPAPNLNDFTYRGDSVCPMHAHVRKVNPRDAYSSPHRIVRRSTVFGPKLQRDEQGRPQVPVTVADGETPGPVGLHFFCCQADIADQFETIQGQWANAMPGGADPIIGQLPPGAQHRISLNGSGLSLSYSPVVRVTEGEYFFAPSISFFSKL